VEFDTPSLLLVFSSFFVNHPVLRGFGIAGELLSLWAIGLVTIILLWQCDLDLKLLGWVSVIFIWELAIVAGVVQRVNNPVVTSLLWELYTNLWCAMGCIISLSLLGLAGHTLRLLWREFH
jgi:hypothetical protein